MAINMSRPKVRSPTSCNQQPKLSNVSGSDPITDILGNICVLTNRKDMFSQAVSKLVPGFTAVALDMHSTVPGYGSEFLGSLEKAAATKRKLVLQIKMPGPFRSAQCTQAVRMDLHTTGEVSGAQPPEHHHKC